MNVLLDTHTLIWWALDLPQLSPRASEVLQAADTVHLSLASCWELVIKAQLKKLHFRDGPELFLRRSVEGRRLQLLPIEFHHLMHLYQLPMHHRDPFDRLLVAQAQVEKLPIVTADLQIRAYEVEVIW